MNWKKQNERTLFNGKHRSVIEKTFLVPEKGSFSYEIFHENSFSSIACLTKENKFILIERYMPGLERACLSFPGGRIETGEAENASAMREVLEETGYQASEIILLKEVPRSAYATYAEVCFLAIGCEKAHEVIDNDRELGGLKLLSKEELHALTFSPDKKDFEHVQCAALALEYLKENNL